MGPSSLTCHRWKIGKMAPMSLKRILELLRGPRGDCLGLMPAFAHFSRLRLPVSLAQATRLQCAGSFDILIRTPVFTDETDDTHSLYGYHSTTSQILDFLPAITNSNEWAQALHYFLPLQTPAGLGRDSAPLLTIGTASRRTRRTGTMNVGGIISIVVGGICIIVMLIVLLCRIGAWSLCNGLERRHVV